MATGITESDVWTAADALLLEGARPTIERVRQKIGRGSPNTVSPYLETWFKALGARIRDPRAFASQEAVPDPVAQAAARLWDAALELARAEQTAAQRDAQAELAAQRQANADEAERLRQHALALAREDDMRLSLAVAGTQLEAAESRLRAAEAQCASVMPSGMPRRPSWPNPARRNRRCRRRRNKPATRMRRPNPRSNPPRRARAPLAQRTGRGTQRRQAPAVQAGRGRRGEPTQDGRAGGRAATRRGTPADRGTRGPGPVCRTGGAADKAGGGTGRGALGGGTGGREREGAGRAWNSAAQTQTAELQARIREQDGQLAALTRHLMMLTTPAPAAPEMATGQGSD